MTRRNRPPVRRAPPAGPRARSPSWCPGRRPCRVAGPVARPAGAGFARHGPGRRHLPPRGCGAARGQRRPDIVAPAGRRDRTAAEKGGRPSREPAGCGRRGGGRLILGRLLWGSRHRREGRRAGAGQDRIAVEERVEQASTSRSWSATLGNQTGSSPGSKAASSLVTAINSAITSRRSAGSRSRPS